MARRPSIEILVMPLLDFAVFVVVIVTISILFNNVLVLVAVVANTSIDDPLSSGPDLITFRLVVVVVVVVVVDVWEDKNIDLFPSFSDCNAADDVVE